MRIASCMRVQRVEARYLPPVMQRAVLQRAGLHRAVLQRGLQCVDGLLPVSMCCNKQCCSAFGGVAAHKHTHTNMP